MLNRTGGGAGVEGQVANAAARLDRLPIGSFHYRVLWLVGLGGMFDTFDLYLGGSVLAELQRTGWSDLNGAATFISATFVGMTLGAIAAGWIGDRFGRRFTFQTNLLIFGLSSVFAAFAPDMQWLIFFRFLIGIGLGAEVVAIIGMMSEYVPPGHRGRWYAATACIMNLGFFFQTLLSYVVIPQLGWRAMFLIAAAGAFTLMWVRKSMPESPRWLESRGRHAEADAILQAIERKAEGDLGHPLPEPAAPPVSDGAPARWVQLFHDGLVGRTILASLICVTVNTSAFSFITWLPTFFVRNGETVAASLGFATLMAFGGPMGAVVAYLTTDRIGRRAGTLISVVFAIAFAIPYPFLSQPIFLLPVGFLLTTALFAMFTFAFYGYVGELFPTALRLRGVGFAHTIGRMSSIVTPFIVASLFAQYGVSGVVAFVVSTLTLLFVGTIVLGPNTLNRSLEEISSR